MSEDATTILHRTLLGDAWDEANLPVAVFGDDRRFITANAAFFRLTGYDREHLAELRAGQDLGADEPTRSHFEAVVQSGLETGDGRLRRRDGTTVDVRFTVAATKVARLPYFIAVMAPSPGR